MRRFPLFLALLTACPPAGTETGPVDSARDTNIDTEPGTSPDPDTTAPVFATVEQVLTFEVVDQQGRALPGATIQAGSTVLVTDDDGLAEAINHGLSGAQTARVKVPGYGTGFAAFNGDREASFVTVTLAAQDVQTLADGALGGALRVDDATVIMPQGAFVDASGAAVTGEVDVLVSMLSSSELASAPSLRVDGGVLNMPVVYQVDFEDASGQILGSNLPIRLSGGMSIDELVQLDNPAVYLFDGQQWLEVGRPRSTGDGSVTAVLPALGTPETSRRSVFSATASGATLAIGEVVSPDTCHTARLVDTDGTPLTAHFNATLLLSDGPQPVSGFSEDDGSISFGIFTDGAPSWSTTVSASTADAACERYAIDCAADAPWTACTNGIARFESQGPAGACHDLGDIPMVCRTPREEQPIDSDGDNAPDDIDCAPDNPNVFPRRAETTCSDGLDNDCDGQIDCADSDCASACGDADGDGFSATSAGGSDCDDNNPEINVNAQDTTCDGVDTNCDGVVDELCDGDGDGHVRAFDCNDADDSVYPGARETCGNQIDDDCDGQLDNGELWFPDTDGDGFGGIANPVSRCPGDPDDGLAPGANDCDDTNPQINPMRQEVRCDGIDNDCSANTPDAPDVDGDGVSVCDGDCNDASVLAAPGNIEVCGDAFDNDCNGQSNCADPACSTDPVCVTCTDADSDGYCAEPGPQQDCDDTVASTHPGAREECDDADNNCNGSVDEGLLIRFYENADGDDFGRNHEGILACEAPDGWVRWDGDCDDTDPLVGPFADEVCDQIDNNCDGVVDEGVRIRRWADVDGDGFGDPAVVLDFCNTPPPGVARNPDDCDDSLSGGDINPGAADVCDDGIDNDCSGVVDDDLSCLGETVELFLTGMPDGLEFIEASVIQQGDQWDSPTACTLTAPQVWGPESACTLTELGEEVRIQILTDGSEPLALMVHNTNANPRDPGERGVTIRWSTVDTPAFLLNGQYWLAGFITDRFLPTDFPDRLASTALELCDDGVSNNGDSRVDCADPTCDGTQSCDPVELCANGIDDEGDGLTDCFDDDCDTHPNCVLQEETGRGGANCFDGWDNDQDGLTDCDDPDCESAVSACREDNNQTCSDSNDNDGDGLIDCLDPSCADIDNCIEGGPPPLDDITCTDGQDNDLDGDIDCADSGCAANSACREDANCTDEADNDGDGLVDCADSDCATLGFCQENGFGGSNCGDGSDNDSDGLVDCDDSDCIGSFACRFLGDITIEITSADTNLHVIGWGAGQWDTATDCFGGTDVDLPPLGESGGDCTWSQGADSQSVTINGGADQLALAVEFTGTTEFGFADWTGEVTVGTETFFIGGPIDEVLPWAFVGTIDDQIGLRDGFEYGYEMQYAGPIELCADGTDNDGDTASDCDDTDDTTTTSCADHPACASCGQMYYPDVDEDGLGDASHPGRDVCLGPVGWVTNNGDCDDTNDGVGRGDDYWPDVDGDLAGDALEARVESCTPVQGFVTNDLDCDDANPDVSPFTDEVCSDGVDSDCDGLPDEGDPDCGCTDSDGDGFCGTGGDCNDDDPNVNPSAEELCGSGMDFNCNGDVDCADSACSDDPECQERGPQCEDGIDNDLDGATDCEDDDCRLERECRESGPQCGDGMDNDLDGATDCEDDDCRFEPNCP